MHISSLLATAKTRAVSPKEPARIQKSEDEDALCDESKQAHRQSV
jgi:Tfp pilus assembly protein FimT